MPKGHIACLITILDQSRNRITLFLVVYPPGPASGVPV